MPVPLSYIITYREAADRRGTLSKVMGWLAGVSGLDLVLVEQDDRPGALAPGITAGCRCVFARNAGLFNRAWGLNVGFRAASADVLAFGDADVILDSSRLRAAAELCSDGVEAVNPYSELIDLTREETEALEPGAPPTVDPGRPARATSFAGGIVLFRREAFMRIGGFDERFRGWGGEDDALSFFKIPLLLSETTELEGRAFHLWHSRSENDGPGQPQYEANRRLLKRYEEWSVEDLLSQAKGVSIGQLDKYENG